ncbi:septum formation family protein [Amycolatopsis sp. NPDC051371]|uniref:septum formation family protein n=1 Tax=Amycolatopsis sp. NPDC051371 TaxID=3155800 RepID=UPI00343A169E
MGSRRFLVLVLPLLLAGCTTFAGGRATPATVVPTTPGVPRPGTGVGPYRSGDCLELPADDGEITKVGCDRPHEYEVMTSASFTPDVPATYPPDVKRLARPACRTALPAYLGSPDADASTLETFALWPKERDWSAGARWYACLVTARGGDNKPVKQPGALAGVLARGLGRFQECRAGEPLKESPVHVVPCTGTHRSEALPGVRVLGPATDPPVDLNGPEVPKAIADCERKAIAYLGGRRPGTTSTVILPIPQDWPTGETTAVCWVISEQPVPGPLGRG